MATCEREENGNATTWMQTYEYATLRHNGLQNSKLIGGNVSIFLSAGCKFQWMFSPGQNIYIYKCIINLKYIYKSKCIEKNINKLKINVQFTVVKLVSCV